ncbi:MAG: hypothetical protein HYU84_15025 [Chloroflexi bacterium]|nr:hypothetical protein [Chloroflexota bacterium]MBI3169112.1 hypothetical protein [Chloroflexota bacterium]
MEQSDHLNVYVEVLTAIVQRFLKLIGEPALKLARRVYGLRVNDDGVVTSYQGDGMIAIQGLVIEYMTLIGAQAVPLTQRAIDPARQKNPDIKLPSLIK